MNMNIKKTVVLSLGLLALPSTWAAVNNMYIQSDTRMSSITTLPQQAKQNKVAFLDIHNMTGKNLNFAPQIQQSLQAEGYTLVNSPLQANQVISVDIVQADKNTMSSVYHAIADGYGSAVKNCSAYNPSLMVGTNLPIGVKDANLVNLTYSIIADVRISIKQGTKMIMTQTPQTSMGQNGMMMTSMVQQTLTQTTWENYDSRMAAYTYSVNMPFDQAAMTLTQNITMQIAKIMQ